MPLLAHTQVLTWHPGVHEMGGTTRDWIRTR